jgi:hypothetical protein
LLCVWTALSEVVTLTLAVPDSLQATDAVPPEAPTVPATESGIAATVPAGTLVRVLVCVAVEVTVKVQVTSALPPLTDAYGKMRKPPPIHPVRSSSRP